MSELKDIDTGAINESISGSRTLRFESVKGFAQRRPIDQKESKSNATDDNTGRNRATSGNEPCADSSGHCVNCRAR